jgi:hypothetical protein
MTKYRHCSGLTIKIKRALGIAPSHGPKNGTILVTPMITLTKIAYGVPIMLVHAKQMIPIMIESTILPLINPPKVLWIKRTFATIWFAVGASKKAYTIFLACPANISLLPSI